MIKGMGSGSLVSLDEYLSTSYRPDCEYLEGIVLERHLGEKDHSNLQMRLSAYLFARREQWRIHVYPEQRIQVSKDRFRVPDICVVVGEAPPEQIFIRPPFLCIEILSKDDRMSEMLQRVSDYLTFGVGYIWLLDPRTRRAQVYNPEGVHEIRNGMLWTAAPEILVPLDDLFE